VKEPRVNKKSRFSFGPALLVTAAFIGPGTVMAASKAGAQFGFLLIWAVVFSVFATIVLQEMAARVGIVTGGGLGEAVHASVANRVVKFLGLGLVLAAILIGNAAYQTGNVLGAAKGAKDFMPSTSAQNENDGEAVTGWADPQSKSFQNLAVCLTGVLAIAVIWVGRIDLLQKLLMLLVAGMSVMFVLAAVRCQPDWGNVAKGLIPRVPQGAEWIVVGLIGTTVVPYNLFLHASSAAERWKFAGGSEADRRQHFLRSMAASRWDTVLSILLGGMVTCAILITAGVAFGPTGEEAISFDPRLGLAAQLEPALGSSAKIVFAIGLFAAGLTSAITAPIAAAYAASGCFGWSGQLSDVRLKWTATSVVFVGAGFAVCLGGSPDQTIIFAQVANGLLLPIIAVFLLVMVNRADLMKGFRNRRTSNVLAVIVICVVSLIAFKNLRAVKDKLFVKDAIQVEAVESPPNNSLNSKSDEPEN
jgi:manganese transport protein